MKNVFSQEGHLKVKVLLKEDYIMFYYISNIEILETQNKTTLKYFKVNNIGWTWQKLLTNLLQN